jgi:uncharacterized protein related to proFAR isomerase
LGDRTSTQRIAADRVRGVVDLSNDRAVHARAGAELSAQRAAYRPAEPRWSAAGDPVGLVDGYLRLGLRHLYVADLDAIGGGAAQYPRLRQLVDRVQLTGGDLWIDAGIHHLAQIEQLRAELPARGWRLVVGTETLQSPEDIDRFAAAAGQRLVVSADLWRGAIVAPIGNRLRQGSLSGLIGRLKPASCAAVVALALDAVGRTRGIGGTAPRRWTTGDLQSLQRKGIESWVGGGLGTAAQVLGALAVGSTGVLLGTALLAGRIGSSPLPFCRRTAGLSLTGLVGAGSVKIGCTRTHPARRPVVGRASRPYRARSSLR